MSFGHVVEHTLCPYSSGASWQEVTFPPGQPSEQAAAHVAGEVRDGILRAEAEGADMLALRVEDPAIRDGLHHLAAFVGHLLPRLSDDPRSIGDDSVMLQEDWRLWVSGVQCFVLVFAPFYSPRHPRYSPTADAYVVFQFESSFERNGVTTLTPRSLGKLSRAVRDAFEARGRWYFPEITHEAPEAFRVIKPLEPGDPPVAWWKLSGPSPTLPSP